MKIEIKEILDANTIRVTTPDERFYQYPKTKEWFASSTWISSYVPSKQLARWMAKTGFDEAEVIKREAGEKGSRVHKGIEVLISGFEVFHNDSFSDGEGNNKEISAEEYEAIISFYDWVKEVKPKFLTSEKTIFNEEYKYAGTLDCMAEIGGQIYLIDFKTSANIYLSHEVQISSYFHADNIKADKMAILQVGYGKNKKFYKFTEIEDKFGLFLSAHSFWVEENLNKQPKQKDYAKSIKLNKEGE